MRAVANLTRRDGEEFLALAPRIPIRGAVASHPLAEVKTALDRLHRGAFRGSAVIVTETATRVNHVDPAGVAPVSTG